MSDYFGFVAAAYGLSAVALGGLALWIALDALSQRRALQAHEASGVRRRSDTTPARGEIVR